MKRLLLATVALTALIGTPALAADLARPVYKAPPPPPLFSWTGFYLGANLGGHWGTDDITTTTDPASNTGGAGAAAEVDARSPVSLHPKGVIGGVQAGFNWQINYIVVGVEADANGLSGEASRSLTFTGAAFINPADIETNSTKATFLATIRPRVGVTFDRLLLYVTGGVAFGTVKTTDTFCQFGCTVPGGFTAVSATTTRTGWTVGAGVEYGFIGNWSLKAEYLHVDLGSFSAVLPNSAAALALGVGLSPTFGTINHKYTDDIARVGVNYRFGGPVYGAY